MKANWKSYYKPTPILMRKIGDSLLAVATFVSTYAITQNYKVVAIVSLIVGSIGKFLTNFFADDNLQDNTLSEQKDESQ